ncbi:hypothetical protein GGR51DRAFT_540682 [Nemania sp. FL0031]|nr:hypothetical protein GGR51DRAFT_540682 [Nemania sp. FL0031]
MIKIGQQLGFDDEERQIRCAPHALQLVVRALLYGEGCKRLPLDQVLANWGQDSFANEDEENDTLDRAFREVVFDISYSQVDTTLQDFDGSAPDIINTETMAKYQKNGPFGKVHNQGNCFRSSNQLVGALHVAQKEINPLVNTKEWVHNNATRW